MVPLWISCKADRQVRLGKKTIWIQRWVYHPSSQNNVHMTPFDNGYNWKLYILAHTVGILFCCVTNLVNYPYGKPKNKPPRGDGFHPTQCWQVGEWYGDGLWVCDFGCIALFFHYCIIFPLQFICQPVIYLGGYLKMDLRIWLDHCIDLEHNIR